MKRVFSIASILLVSGLLAFGQQQAAPKTTVAIEPPIPIIKVQAKYTDAARAARVEGTAMVRMIVNNMGVPEDVTFMEWLRLNVPPDQDRGLREKAVEAARQWRFKAATKDGRPTSMAAHIKLNFRLP